MATDHIRYDLLVQDAFRGIFRKVLTDAAAHGLPGEHHFYITFKTQAPGVVMSDRLRAEYPEQMTIILQHQFWDLKVHDQGFEVGLSFRRIPEKLQIPFAAVSGFFDPSVNFGAEFTAEEDQGEAEGEDADFENAEPAAASPKKEEAPARVAPVESAAKARGADHGEAVAPAKDQKEEVVSDTPKVVSIDAFRKKNT
ncbi:MAG: ClpXP protease specificity-enhancing factor SspB [Beijerinckiaceae bacterium]